jgi:acyl-CoA thioesterase I
MLREQDIVLLQGDSITNAFRRPEEINNAYQLGAGYAFLVASRLMAERPGANLTFHNRAVSGNRLIDLASRWDDDCLRLRPTVLSLLIGINEILHPEPDTAFAGRLQRLLSDTVASCACRLIIMEPFALCAGDIDRRAKERLRPIQDSTQKVAGALGATFIPLQCVFDAALDRAPAAYWIYDGIHPTAPGHRLIADAWLAAVNFEPSSGVGF